MKLIFFLFLVTGVLPTVKCGSDTGGTGITLCSVFLNVCSCMHVKSICTFSYYCNELIIVIFSKHNVNYMQMQSC